MSKFMVENWKNLVAIMSVIWSGFCFVYILSGLPSRVKTLEAFMVEYQMERIPPRVITLEGDVKNLEKEISVIKADLQENYRITLNTYQLVKEMRDELVRETFRRGHYEQ